MPYFGIATKTTVSITRLSATPQQLATPDSRRTGRPLTELLIATIGLGIAGLDPIGALIAIGALSRGTRDRTVVAYGLVMIAVTVALGIVLSLTVGARLANIDWSFLDSGYQFWAIGEAIAGVALLVWGIRRILHPAGDASTPRDREPNAYALLGLGVVYGLSAVLDPTFVALVVLAGRDGTLLEAGLAHLLWILISQAPMVIVIVAIAMGKHEPVISWFQSWWQRMRPIMAHIGTGLALLAGFVLLVDAGWWFVTDEFLIQF